jgi:peroxiredoxin
MARAVALAISMAATACTPSSPPAPDFEYTLLGRTRAEARELRGRVVLVNFWATTCAVCVDEMPELVALHERYAGHGLTTLGVAMRHDPPARVASFAESRRLPFGVVIDNTGDIARRFGNVDSTPTTFVIDRRGRIAERIVGVPDFAALDGLLRRLLTDP